MQRDLVDRLAAEAGARALGRLVRAVLSRPGAGLALALEGSDRAALDIAPGPPEPRLALTTRPLPSAPSAPADALRPRLVGRRLVSVGLPARDRIVRFVLDDGAALVLEILGPLSNLYYTGPDGLVQVRARACARPGGMELRVGDPWVPMPGAGDWQEVLPVLTAAPGLASPWDPDRADPLRALRSEDVGLRTDGALPDDAWFEAHATLGDAATRRHEILGRHASADERRRKLTTRVRGARRRLERLQRGLESDEQRAVGHEEMRRQATAILAGLSRVESTATGLRVPDPWRSDEGWIEIESPPGRAAARVADDLFRAAGRLERGLLRLRARARQVAETLERIRGLEAALSAVPDLAALGTMEAQADAWLPPPSPKGPADGRRGEPRPRAGRLEKDARSRRIRRLETPEGWPVFIGGSATDNDWLTFRLANGHDFWLHAADYPGAHVVVRNPARQSDPPPAVLHQAAAWALHFSKAPRDERGTVRWTQVRHLRRSRGSPPGTVFLARFATVAVTPAPPPGRDPFGPP